MAPLLEGQVCFVCPGAALNHVHGSLQVRLKISEICSLLNVDGIRGDIVINRAARALVALEGRTTVELSDVGRIISICLNHRQATGPNVHDTCLRYLGLAPHARHD